MVAAPLLLFEFFGGVLLLLLQIAGGDDWLELLGFELWERGASKVACFLDKGTRRRSGATGSGGEEDCAMLRSEERRVGKECRN